MKKYLAVCLVFITTSLSLFGAPTPWNDSYTTVLMEKVGGKIAAVSAYPSLRYPNKSYKNIFKHHGKKKILLFGYGSLINPTSAARSMSDEGVKTMKPVVAFGLKRIFNYKVGNTTRYPNLEENERAMLNVSPRTTFNYVINGVVMEVTEEDLGQLIKREVGYDLVPILVANWDDVTAENPSVHLEVAYTFLVPDELREGVDYTQTKYYPVRNYLQAVRDGATLFGTKFLEFWNATTYLGDGTTSVNNWDETNFSNILDSREP